MKVAFFEVKAWERPLLRQRLKGHRLAFYREPLNAETASLARGAEAVSVFIYSGIDKEVLARLPRLRLVTTRSTGFDHIRLSACKKRGVAVCNVPFYGENTVAEHTFALILALSRNVHKSYLRTVHNDFSIQGLKGFDLAGKTLGVVGAGHIGLHVIRIAKGFGMRVLAHDPHQDRFLAEVLGFSYVSLERLLRESDIVSLHVPYNRKTHHLINRETLALCKKGALLINTARGAVVDTEALLEALDSGRLGGAGLDVLEGERFIKEEKELLYEEKNQAKLATLAKDYVLLHKDNVVFTPHIAFYSEEALRRILETTVENILAFAAGKAKNRVA